MAAPVQAKYEQLLNSTFTPLAAGFKSWFHGRAATVWRQQDFPSAGPTWANTAKYTVLDYQMQLANVGGETFVDSTGTTEVGDNTAWAAFTPTALIPHFPGSGFFYILQNTLTNKVTRRNHERYVMDEAETEAYLAAVLPTFVV